MGKPRSLGGALNEQTPDQGPPAINAGGRFQVSCDNKMAGVGGGERCLESLAGKSKVER